MPTVEDILGPKDDRPMWNRKFRDCDKLQSEYLELLDQKLAEQKYQEFLEKNTELIPREFVQNHGVHFQTVFRKLRFGSDFISDFCYLSKSTDDWNCILIEIEKPQSKFFKGSSSDLHSDFVKGVGQITKWRAWLSKRENFDHFVNSTLGAFRYPLQENPVSIKYVLVTGRRGEYQSNAGRRADIKSYERDDFKIISYDSLAESLETKWPLYVAAKRNDHVQILSDDLIGTSLFAWQDPTQICVNTSLLEKIKKHKTTRYVKDPSSGKSVEVFRYVEDKLRFRK